MVEQAYFLVLRVSVTDWLLIQQEIIVIVFASVEVVGYLAVRRSKGKLLLFRLRGRLLLLHRSFCWLLGEEHGVDLSVNGEGLVRGLAHWLDFVTFGFLKEDDDLVFVRGKLLLLFDSVCDESEALDGFFAGQGILLVAALDEKARYQELHDLLRVDKLLSKRNWDLVDGARVTDHDELFQAFDKTFLTFTILALDQVRDLFHC